ncbi:MAG TPA: M13 family metallopeptidase [Myxococcota bacterium]|nr:M13 family metallopeptidase [Myxococcota bacterium]HRY93982.1 M13 family metallopeptidase [Myxococcota bacterium]HSA22695.1 M13 family metallopeptidase [Myxococcota bacterium]
MRTRLLLLTPALAATALGLVLACAGGPQPAGDGQAHVQPPITGIDLAAIDPGAKPCEDFYAFACGGWIANHEIPPDKARWGMFDQLGERNLGLLRELLEEAAAGKSAPEDVFGQKVGDFYAACMDEAGIERSGLAELQAEWAKLEAVQDPASLAAAVGRIQRSGVGVLFNFGAMQDFEDSRRMIAGVFQGGLSLPDRDYYLKDDPKNAQIRKSYLAYLEAMLGLAGVPQARASEEARAVFELERAMAESHWSRTEMRDPQKIFHPLDRAGLEGQTPGFDWPSYFQAVGAVPPERFNASTPQALARLAELLGKTPPETWRAYLRWHVLRGLVRSRALPRAFVDRAFAFSSENFTGAKELEPRWKHCADLSDSLLGEAVGQAFVRRHFAGDAKDKALALIRGVQRAQGENLKSLPWMDAATRTKASEKLAAIDNKIGYPDTWRDYSALEITRSSLLRSLLAAMAFETQRDLDKIGKPVDRREWFMSAPTVNAYYSAQLNEMVFPAGILQPMFYTPGANDAVNHGAIGFVMGHELTHGFDDEGRKFDAQGNLAEWWSPSVAQEFEQRAACIERQYGEYVVVDDLRLNGKLTLGENIADLGGLELALAAYRASRAGLPPEPAVGGYTPEQQFFLAAGQVWCARTRPEEARNRVVTDPHSSPRWRVNGPLSNMPDFAAAFGCQAGDAMVRAERCEVW